MAGIGLLFFGVTARDARTRIPSAWVVRLIAAGVLLLLAHLAAWIRDISPNGTISTDFVASVFGSTPGQMEGTRITLAVLALWAAALARRGTLALIFGIASLAVSGAIGHPAAIDPVLSVPTKAIHLLAGAAWLGGLLWLAGFVRREDVAFPVEARRVSSIALICAIAILASGCFQTLLFLNRPTDLIGSAYGRLALIKIVGVLALIGLGAFNRFILLPVVDDSGTRPALKRTIRQEIAIMILLILVGGFLAYVPTPPAPQADISGSTGATL
jgi:putative copper export protein